MTQPAKSSMADRERDLRVAKETAHSDWYASCKARTTAEREERRLYEAYKQAAKAYHREFGEEE